MTLGARGVNVLDFEGDLGTAKGEAASKLDQVHLDCQLGDLQRDSFLRILHDRVRDGDRVRPDALDLTDGERPSKGGVELALDHVREHAAAARQVQMHEQ